MKRRMLPVLSTGVAATLLTGIAAVIAPSISGAIPNDGRIYACYSKLGGFLRVVDQGTPCWRTERPLSWSQEGTGGGSGEPSMWYTVRNYQASDVGTTLSTSQTSLLTMTLPELESNERYLLTATFTLVNKSASTLASAADAGVTCDLGNVMGVTDLVVADGVSPRLSDGVGGMYSSNRRTFTLTGITDYGVANLECAVANYTDGRDLPTVTFVGGYLTAERMLGTQVPDEAAAASSTR